MKTSIRSVCARQVLDSRGNPTVEAEVRLEDSSVVGRAIVPSGASTGSKEALELRDHGQEYLGRSVHKAVSHVNNQIAKAIANHDASNQNLIDAVMLELDGTQNKANLGANAILAVSLACAKAAAKVKGLPLYEHIAQLNGTQHFTLPVPMMNILNGGQHADNNLDIQEFMIQPVGAKKFHEALRMGVEIFHHLKSILAKKNMTTAVGDEGGFAPNLNSNAQALSLIEEAVQQAGYQLRTQITLALDCAASEFYQKGRYLLTGENLSFDSAELINYLGNLKEQYAICSIEDALDENDWAGWQAITKKMGDSTQLVGDDLFVTNTHLLKRGISEKAGNAILIKVNQIGTLSETLSAIRLAKKAGFGVIISHRSGETEDTFIADLAVGTAANQIKTGSLCRSDRVAKYNQLLRIEDGNTNIPYAGSLQ